MAKFVLKILSGSLKGQTFDLKKGLKIGRTEGDILLKDSSVSSLHAKIDISSSGKMIIEDQGSKNRIFTNGKEVIKMSLKKGTRFTIGETKFEVLQIMTIEEVVSNFLKKISKNFKDNPLSLKPFSKPLKIFFLSGLQKGKTYYLSYGPRFFGSESVDFPIFEERAPKNSFVLTPEQSGTYFKTKDPEIVFFNGKQIEKQKVKNGDRVTIGQTQMQIFIK